MAIYTLKMTKTFIFGTFLMNSTEYVASCALLLSRRGQGARDLPAGQVDEPSGTPALPGPDPDRAVAMRRLLNAG